MISIEATILEERTIDAVSAELRAVCRKLPPALLGRAIARAIMQAETEGPLPDAPAVLGVVEPADADFLRAPVIPAEHGTAGPVRHWDHAGQPTAPPDTNGQRLVPVPRPKADAFNGESGVDIAPDAVLRRVLMYIASNPGANLTDLRKEVHGKVEDISEALRAAGKAGHIEDKGTKTRRAYHLTEAGKTFLQEASATPLPPKHGHKSETLLSFLRERGRIRADHAAEPIYGSKDRWAINRARNLLHQLVYQGQATSPTRGWFEIAPAALQ